MPGTRYPAYQSRQERLETLMANRSGAASSEISDQKVGYSWSEKPIILLSKWRSALPGGQQLRRGLSDVGIAVGDEGLQRGHGAHVFELAEEFDRELAHVLGL